MAELEREIPNAGSPFEAKDWPLLPVALVALGVLVFLAVAVLALRAAFPLAVADASRKLEVEPPSPRLLVQPTKDLERYRVHERNLLDSYGWIDRQKGIVHIPIAEAMKDVAAKGIDGFPAAKQP